MVFHNIFKDILKTEKSKKYNTFIVLISLTFHHTVPGINISFYFLSQTFEGNIYDIANDVVQNGKPHYRLRKFSLS